MPVKRRSEAVRGRWRRAVRGWEGRERRCDEGCGLGRAGVECAAGGDCGGEVQAWVDQNVTFSRPPSGEWLARTRMRSDGDDLGGKGRANSPP